MACEREGVSEREAARAWVRQAGVPLCGGYILEYSVCFTAAPVDIIKSPTRGETDIGEIIAKRQCGRDVGCRVH